MLSEIVGFGEVFQTTPRADTDAPPSEEILPPALAAVHDIEETEVVVSVGVTGGSVVNDTSFPYAVPTLFVA